MLRGVDFDVQGSVALLVSNGAGKTTSEDPVHAAQAGRGHRHRQRLRRLRRARERAGSISLTRQFAAVDETLTGRENLVLVARLRQLKGAPSRMTCWPASCSPTRPGDGVGVFRGHAPPPGHRHEPHRAPAGDPPARTHHRARPSIWRRGVEQRQVARRAGHDGAAHDAYLDQAEKLLTGSRSPSRSDHANAPSPNSRSSSRPPKSSTSRSSRPSRTSFSPSPAATPLRHG